MTLTQPSTPPPPEADFQGALLLRRLNLPAVVTQALAQRRASAAPSSPVLDDPGPARLAPGWHLHPDGCGGWRLVQLPKGGTARLWAAGDRFGWLHLCARWEGSALAEGWFRLPGGGWLELRPRAGEFPLWGRSDVLLHHRRGPEPGGGRRCGLMPALDYAALEAIPPFDRPTALPAGAGSAVLNFLALLLALGGRTQVAYRGPYPTAALFGALCRSFVPEEPLEVARTAFSLEETALAFRAEMAPSPVSWRPAPFAACRPAEGLLLHLRQGPETAWVRGVPFRPAPAGGPALACGERVWAEPPPADAQGEARFAVGLALLGRPLVRFYRLDRTGTVLQAAPLPPPDAALPQPGPVLDARWRAVLFHWAVLRAHAGLATELVALGQAMPVCWADLPLALAALDAPGAQPRSAKAGCLALRVHLALATEYRSRAVTEDAAALAMMLISDVLEAATPHLLRAAQRRMEVRPPPEPAALLAAGSAAQEAARESLALALPALVQALTRGEALPDAS